ncbi:BlaI/MecI/CopY family transcriptional regulator [Nonomuraea sp. NPDC052129]
MARGLGELESAVMGHIWSCDGPVSVREVLQALQRRRVLAYTTVMTVMDNLHKKGLLRRHPSGRAYLYEPVMSHEAYSAQIMQEALAKGGNQAMTLVHFLERLTPEEHAALDAAIHRSDQQ